MKRKPNSATFKNTYTQETVTGYSIASAFDAAREELNLKPLREDTKKPLAEHTCPICGSVKTHIEGTNIMVCTNPDCSGYKPRKANEDSESLPSFSKIGSFKNN